MPDIEGCAVAEALRERIDGIEKLFHSLRIMDLEAIKVARDDVKERMSGFPAEYAKKVELDAIRDTAIRLDRQSLSREAYETAHEALEEAMTHMLGKEVFEATMREWTVWRRSIDDTVSTQRGATATWSRIIVLFGVMATAVTLVISFVVLVANHTIG